eukprot:4565892-Pleurochrysis_carterae.AAC.2
MLLRANCTVVVPSPRRPIGVPNALLQAASGFRCKCCASKAETSPPLPRRCHAATSAASAPAYFPNIRATKNGAASHDNAGQAPWHACVHASFARSCAVHRRSAHSASPIRALHLRLTGQPGRQRAVMFETFVSV